MAQEVRVDDANVPLPEVLPSDTSSMISRPAGTSTVTKEGWLKKKTKSKLSKSLAAGYHIIAPSSEYAAVAQTPDPDHRSDIDARPGRATEADAGRLDEDLSMLRVFFINSKGGAAGLRAVCGVASSLLLINLLQLAER